MSIPPGALPGDLSISVASASGAATPGGVEAVGVPYLFGPEGTQFATPVTVTLKVEVSKLPAGKSLADVIVYTAPAGTKQYVALVTSVTDATHVSAKTYHFSVIVPGVPSSSTDCRVSCSAFGSGSTCMPGTTCPPPVMGSDCAASCMGHQYDVNCSSGTCTCSKDGATTGSATLSGTDTFAAYQAGCGFPGDQPCDFTCTAGADTRTSPATGGSTNPAPASATASCGCYGSCKGMYYTLACLDCTCTCGVASGSTGTGGSTNPPAPASFGFSIASFTLSCDTDTTGLEASWVNDCNYPGTVAAPSYGDPTGTGIDVGIGNADGGTVMPPDAGTSTPDLSTSGADLACAHLFMASARG